MITPGKNFDGYWKNDDVVEQHRDKAVRAFDYLHPDKTAAFAFDNSSNHHSVRGNGLCVSSLNLADGGKNTPLMRDTTFKTANGAVKKQKMQQVVRVDGEVKSIQKGVKSILTERGLWHDKLLLECSRKNEPWWL